jgi:hypothetical protein
VQTIEGKRVVVAADWTDIETERVHESPSPTHILDYNGLAQAAELIEHLRIKECQSEDESYDGIIYDGSRQPQIEPSSEAQNEASNPKQRTGNPEPGMGAIELRAAGWSDPSDGTVGTQTDRGTVRKQPERGL